MFDHNFVNMHKSSTVISPNRLITIPEIGSWKNDYNSIKEAVKDRFLMYGTGNQNAFTEYV